MTRITDDLLQQAPTFTAAFEDLKHFAKDAVLVTQAAYEYDIPLLKRHDIEWYESVFKITIIKPIHKFSNVFYNKLSFPPRRTSNSIDLWNNENGAARDSSSVF